MWELYSPDGRICIQGEGALLRVTKEGRCQWEAELGFELNTGSVSFAKPVPSAITTAKERYALPCGKLDWYEENANECLVDYGMVRLRVRADVQGAAFRYEFPGEGQCLTIAEKTCFHFAPEYETLYAQDLFSTYERPYDRRSWQQAHQQQLGMPVLLESTHGWALVSEADLLTRADYCSCHLVGDEHRRLRIAFALEEHGNPLPIALPFVTPWRYVTLCDDLNALIQSHLAYNLCQPPAQQDWSWVRPARALWAWWEYENGAQLYTESRHYVDTAADMGFEAVVLDCGWDANWVPRLCRYAHTKGIQLWLWTDRHRVDTPEKMERYLPLWASWGIDGLKIDFFENDSMQTMKAYRMLLERTAQLRLMVNFHGATKPAGDGRTWPHLMTSEGIMGLEHYKWSDMPHAVHNCTVPFIRNVCGPMDYTPVGYTNLNRNTTHAHQLALPVVFESGVTHYSLSVYLLEGWAGTRFLRRTKPKYDEVRLLQGRPGKDVAILRRKDGEYLIGAITAEKQQMSLTLDFLPEGSFTAEIYEDDEKDQMLSIRTCTVDRHTTLCLPLKPCGGAAVWIAREPAPLPEGKRTVSHVGAQETVAGGGSEPVRFVDGQDGLLLYGSASFTVQALRQGWHTLRMYYTAHGKPRVRFRCGKNSEVHTLGEGKSVFDMRTFDVPLWLEEGANCLQLEREGDTVPAFAQWLLLDESPVRWQVYGKADARLTGSAEWTQNVRGVWEAVGLGRGSELHFDRVEASCTGDAVLSIRYCGGESRDLSVQINGGEAIHTYLHSTSGWGFPTWKNAENKELVIPLQEGFNHIRLFCDHGPMSHICSIAICSDLEE